MFGPKSTTSKARGFWSMMEVIYHSIVRKLRQGHRNAVVGMLLSVMRSLVMVAAFLFMFMVLGLRSSPIRGDFLLYIMSGIFMYMTHIRAVSSVAAAEGPTSSMMKHAPMNTVVAIISSALSSLYQQMLTLAIILTIYHCAITPITIYEPLGALAMMILAWFSGVAVGTVFLAISPWMPDFIGLVRRFYIRINMIASGKMFVVNTLPATMVALFDWNPLFHIIDQTRGFVFLNYSPFVTNISYPIYASIGVLMLGLMGEFYTRRSVSLSWTAGR
jgi:ABC-type polysaccharide/polyol phosphate export permease